MITEVGTITSIGAELLVLESPEIKKVVLMYLQQCNFHLWLNMSLICKVQ